ncbi:MAG: molybdenum cofactor biosynthesis protein MoaE, partial [Calditrichaeota bacterium]|nr:molybdenum cofactor biosynthesis protein MoaE [Calditrichota bacterium]
MIEITAEPIDIQKVIDAANSEDCGAVNTFIGTVRNHSHGKAVVRLEYEAYPEMAGKMIQRIIDEAKKQWPVRKIAVSHRVGVL